MLVIDSVKLVIIDKKTFFSNFFSCIMVYASFYIILGNSSLDL
jgi:hypothetical protein